MSKILNQNRIESLFAEMQGGAPAPVAAVTGPTVKADLYKFRQSGQITDEQMKAISRVNDYFAINLKHTIGALLRTKFNVKLVSGEQLLYAEFLERVSEPTYLCSIRLEPLGAMGLLEFDVALALPIIDILLGGTGDMGTSRALTDVEEEILKSVVQLIIRELNTAWASIGLRFEFDQRETVGSASRTMAVSEKTLGLSFEVTMQDMQGAMNFCLPATLNSILRQFASEQDRRRRPSPENQTRIRDLVGNTTVGTTLRFNPHASRRQGAYVARPGEGVAFALVPVRNCGALRWRGSDSASASGAERGASRRADYFNYCGSKYLGGFTSDPVARGASRVSRRASWMEFVGVPARGTRRSGFSGISIQAEPEETELAIEVDAA